MSLHTDEQFLAAVAAALGETIAFVRRRGFHMEHANGGDDQRPARSSSRRRADDEHAERYGESDHEPPHLRERFVPYDKCPPIVRATLPAHAPKLLVQLLQSFSVLTR